MRGNAVIAEDLVIQGELRNGGEIEVRGLVVGMLSASRVVIQSGGRVVGTLIADAAEVHGRIEGRIRVRNLIAIGSTGVVHGDVRYGQLALAPGGDLAAEVRNVPPQLAGDFEMVVRRGRTVRIATADLTAVDPDEAADRLVYRVSNPEHGFVARGSAPTHPVEAFTQAEILAGEVPFVHDGAEAGQAGFDVVVADSSGATSGAARKVVVTVISAA